MLPSLNIAVAWSYDSWIYNNLCNQYLSPLMLWVRISIRGRCTTLGDKVYPWLATGRWFYPGPPVSSNNKTDRHDIAEILLKMALNTIKQVNKQSIDKVVRKGIFNKALNNLRTVLCIRSLCVSPSYYNGWHYFFGVLFHVLYMYFNID